MTPRETLKAAIVAELIRQNKSRGCPWVAFSEGDEDVCIDGDVHLDQLTDAILATDPINEAFTLLRELAAASTGDAIVKVQAFVAQLPRVRALVERL